MRCKAVEAALLDAIEPRAAQMVKDDGRVPTSSAAALSSAISLKRIADALEAIVRKPST